MKSSAYVLPAVAALGFAAGRFVPGAGLGLGHPGSSGIHAGPSSEKEGRDAAHSPVFSSFKPPLPVSTETAESLLRYGNNDLYAPLALWLLDASADQIGGFWAAYLKRGTPKDRIRDLIFTQWAKCDPQGLLAAARRTGQEGSAWWAWGMADPAAALAASEGQPQAIRDEVIKGIAAADPQRGIGMLEQDPRLMKVLDMDALVKFACRKGGREGVEFLLSVDANFALDTPFKDWVGKDPHAASAWLNELGDEHWLLVLFLQRVEATDPAAVKEIAAGLPAGALKRSLEAELFTRLAASDPEKAVEEAHATDSPRVAAERFALLGSELLKGRKPEEALKLLGELLAKCPDAPRRGMPQVSPTFHGSVPGSVTGVPELIAGLAEWNPRVTMEVMLEAGPVDNTWEVARKWLQAQPEEFATWCEQQRDPAVADGGAGLLSQALLKQNDYAGAIAWGMRVSDEKARFFPLGQAFHEWVRQDREAALQWLGQEGARVDEPLRRQFEKSIPPSDP